MLEINVDLMALTAIVFLVLIYLLNTMLYKPMLKFMDERESSIKQSERSVAATAGDLSAYEAEIEQVLLKAREEAGRIRLRAQSEAKEEASKLIDAKRVELEQRYEEFLLSLRAQKAELKTELKADMPMLKSALAKKLASI